jgi:hypothetical protein
MRWLKNLGEWLRPARKLLVHADDSLPDSMPRRDLVVARDGGEDWAAGLSCPCGCGEVLELMLIPEARPRWRLTVDRKNRPSLNPSVWRDSGCGAHFWVQSGRVRWC